MDRETRISRARKASVRTPTGSTLVLWNYNDTTEPSKPRKDRREFFRYEGGTLIEYDLTRDRRRPIILDDKERRAADDFFRELHQGQE